MNVKKIAGVAGVSLLALTACGNQKKDKEEMAVTTPEVKPLTVNCDDASIKNRLVRAVQTEMDEKAISKIKDFDDADKVGLERRLGQRLTELALDLQNVAPVNDSGACQADLHLLLTHDDIKYANAVGDDADSVENLLKDNDLELQADNHVIVPLRYTVDGMEVKLDKTPKGFDSLAHILTASAYGAATDDSSVDLSGRAAPVIKPVAPVAPTVTARVENFEESKSSKSEPKSENKSDTKAEPQKPEPKSDAKPEPKSTQKTDKPSDDNKASTHKNASNDEKSSQTKPQAQTQTKPQSEPKTPTTQKNNNTAQGPAAKGNAANTQNNANQSKPTQSQNANAQTQNNKGQTQSQKGPAATPKASEQGPAAKPVPVKPAAQSETKPESLKVTESDDTY